jgi:cell division protein FtsL
MSPERAAARALRRSDAPDEGVDRVRRHLRVVDAPASPARRRSKAPVLAGVGLLATVFLALFGLVVFHTVLLQNQSQIDGLDEQLTQEREQIKDRRLEVAELESPERVIAVAEAEGLVIPDEVVMLDAVPAVPPERAVGPTPAPQASAGEQAADAPPGTNP